MENATLLKQRIEGDGVYKDPPPVSSAGRLERSLIASLSRKKRGDGSGGSI